MDIKLDRKTRHDVQYYLSEKSYKLAECITTLYEELFKWAANGSDRYKAFYNHFCIDDLNHNYEYSHIYSDMPSLAQLLIELEVISAAQKDAINRYDQKIRYIGTIPDLYKPKLLTRPVKSDLESEEQDETHSSILFSSDLFPMDFYRTLSPDLLYGKASDYSSAEQITDERLQRIADLFSEDLDYLIEEALADGESVCSNDLLHLYANGLLCSELQYIRDVYETNLYSAAGISHKFGIPIEKKSAEFQNHSLEEKRKQYQEHASLRQRNKYLLEPILNEINRIRQTDL